MPTRCKIQPTDFLKTIISGKLSMNQVVISGTGLYTPPYSISNQELITCFNQYVI